MVEHIVLFKLNDGIAEDKKIFFVETLKKLSAIDGIAEMSVGLNHSNEGLDKGFEVGMRIQFINQAALDAYLPSEFHQQVVSEIRPYFTDVIVVDYTA